MTETIEQVKQDIIKRYERLLKEEQLCYSLICQFNSEEKVLQAVCVSLMDCLIDNINSLKNN